MDTQMEEKSETMINILLVENHDLTRRQMVSLIKHQSDMEVVAEAVNGEQSLAQARESKPDVIVMDILLPGISGVDAARQIMESLPGSRILILSNHSGEALVQAALATGALGYVRKDHAFEELIPAIRAVGAGKKFLGAKITER
jgi:two-component system, NarL family, response regulator NreC